MTSDKVLKNELEKAESDLLDIVGSAARIRDDIRKLTKRMDDDEELRSRLTFRYDLSGEDDNRIIKMIQGFLEKNTPENFDLSERQTFSLVKMAREIEAESIFLRPTFSSDTLVKVLGLAFQLGYISGWNRKSVKRQKKAAD